MHRHRSLIRDKTIFFSTILILLICLQTSSFATSPAPNILLVDDDGGRTFESYYRDALDDGGWDYNVSEVAAGEDGPNYETMSEYDIVIWFTGTTSENTLTELDITNLESYMAEGSAFFLSSTYAGMTQYTSYTSFFNNYLNIKDPPFKVNNKQYPWLIGYDLNNIYNLYISETNNPLTTTAPKLDSNIHSTNPVVSRITAFEDSISYNLFDVLTTYSTGINIDFLYNTIATASDLPTHKVVYFGLGFESIVHSTFYTYNYHNRQTRATLMNNIINYLYTPRTTIYQIEPEKTKDNITITATCWGTDLISTINASEFYFNTSDTGDGNNFQLSAKDGGFNTGLEEATITLNATAPPYNLNDGTHTVSVHCQDSAGHWGKYDNKTFIIDRAVPKTPEIRINNGDEYTSNSYVQLKITELMGSGTYYISFSCNGIDFTNDYTVWKNLDYWYYYVDLSNADYTTYGCNDTDGPKTIHIRAKSETGVINTTHTSDSITLDTTAPQFISVGFSNPDTIYKAGDNISLDVDMGEISLTLYTYTYNINGLQNPQLLNDDGDGTYSLNISVDDDLARTGIKTIPLNAIDLADNSVFDYSLHVTIDKTKPDIPVYIETNDGYTNDMTPEMAFEIPTNTPDYISFSCNDITFDSWLPFSNTETYTYNSFNITNTTYGCSTTDGERTIYVRSKDEAGNINASLSYTIIYDSVLPQIDNILPINQSNITHNAQFFANVSDDRYFLFMSYDIDGDEIFQQDAHPQTYANYSFQPFLEVDDGNKNIIFRLYDLAGNILQSLYSYMVDSAPPSTEDNYTLNDWVSQDLQISLNCTDLASGCNTTNYCILEDSVGTCSPDTEGNEVTVTCPVGESCTKMIFYNSTDNSGNVEATRWTSQIKIDKTPPIITVNNPQSSKNYTSIVAILTDITDHDNGTISYADYMIYNSSQINIANGSLNITDNWESSWNSSDYTTGTFNITIFSNDSLGNNITNSHLFQIDNDLPSAIIFYPNKIYTNATSLTLDLKAQKDTGNIDNCSYTIYNGSGVQNSSAKIGVSSKECIFNNQVDISSWSDGNYSINFTAIDESTNQANETSWFYIDSIKPDVYINTQLNNTWNEGRISINYNMTDEIQISDCNTRFKKNSTAPWSSYGRIDCGIDKLYTFNTLNCDDTSTTECLIEFYAKDAADNINDTSLLYLNIDNSLPQLSFTSPAATTWFNSDFTVVHTETDPQGQTCSYKIEGSSSSGWQTWTCSQDILVDVSTYCNISGIACTVYINSTNNVGVGLHESRTFYTDFEPPQLSSFTRTPQIANDGMEIKFNATVSDTNRPIDSVVAYILNTTGAIISQIQMIKISATSIYNGTYTVAGSENGTFTINITANDSLGNFGYDTTTTFLVKNTPPTASTYNLSVDIDPNYGNRRILAGDSITFSVNLSDSIGVNSTIMTLNPQGYPEANYTLTPDNYNYTDDTWSTTMTDTINKTNYSISALYINDTLGNTKLFNSQTINLNFISVAPSTQMIFDSVSNTTLAETTTQLNLSVDFNKTMTNTTLTVYIPPNTKTSNTVAPAYTNSTPYLCIVSVGTCTLKPTFDTNNNTISIDLNLTGPATEASLITNITSKVESIDKVYNWQVISDSIDYGTSSKIITPNLNITSFKCDNSYPCRINQNTSFNVSVNVTNEYDAINHTGNFYNLSIVYSIGGTNQSTNLTDLLSGNSKNTTFYDLIEDAGTYSITIYATDNASSSYSIAETYNIESVDTIAPTLVSTYSFTGDIIYSNTTKSMYYDIEDNVGVNTVWATVIMPDSSVSNKTLEHTSGTWRLDYNDTSQTGTYNITKIYANDTENNILLASSNYTFEVRDMNVSLSLNATSLSVEDTLLINVTIRNNISSIESVIANITKPRGTVEQVTLSFINISDTNITSYSGTYSNITQSDNYTIEIIVSADGDMSELSSFFAEYGTVRIVSAIGLNNTLLIPIDKTYNHSWYIYPIKGDLVDVNATLNISDDTILNFSDSEIILKQLGNISYEQYKTGYLIFWELNTTQIGISDIDLNVSSTYSTNLTTIEINVTDSDSEDPVIGNHSSYSIVNLNDTLEITIGATDNTFVKSVIVEVTDPTQTKTNMTAHISGIGEYTANFDKTTSTGNYSYDIYVSDISDNNASSTNSTEFNVTDKYDLHIVPNYLVYNKGETIDVEVLVYDINNRSVSSFNLSLDLVKDNPVSLVNNTINSSAQYKITTADSPTESNSNKFYEYVFNANVSKYGNTGNISVSVNVTNHLVTSFEGIPNNKYYVVGTPIPLTVKVTNIRGGEAQESIVQVTCPNCPVYSVSLTKVSEYIYSDLERLIAPESVMLFGISADAVDIYKNGKTKDGIDNPIMFLNTDPSSLSNNAESGGVSGAMSDVQNFIQDLTDKIFQIPTTDFKFDSDAVINVVTGETVESLTSIENTGDTRLYLNTDYTLDCCTVDMIDKFTLELNERRSSPITISSNLSEIPDRYNLNLDIISENISKEYIIVVNLIRNPLVEQLDVFKQDYAKLRTLIDDLNFLGVDTSLYEESLRFTKDLIADAQRTINSNNLEELQSINVKLDRGLGNLDKELADKERLKWILENKYSIAGTIVSLLILIYLLQGYFVPFISLSRELKELRIQKQTLHSEEKATEKEYFTRVIDKPTFSKIMTEKHKQLTDVRTHITRLSAIRSKLLHGHPIYSDEIDNDNVINAETKKKLLKHFNKESSIVPKNIISMISDLKNDVRPTFKKQVHKAINNNPSYVADSSVSEDMKRIKAEIMTGPLDATVDDVPVSVDVPEQQLPELQEPSTSDVTPNEIETPEFSNLSPETETTKDITDTDDAEFQRLMDKLKKDLND